MFNFRILNYGNSQVIDTNLKTPIEALNPFELMEYIEIDNNLYYMERKKKKEEKQKAKNPLWKIACLCGIL